MIKIRQALTVVFFVILATVLLAGCQQRSKQDLKDLSPERKAEIVQTVLAWLECEECQDGELERVKKEGDLAVPTLSAALLKGPSPASLELLRLGLEERYDKLQNYSKTHKDMKISQTKADFVAHYLGNYESLYRIRAAEALSTIGSKQAKQSLMEASKGNFREDVNKAVKKYLEKK